MKMTMRVVGKPGWEINLLWWALSVSCCSLALCVYWVFALHRQQAHWAIYAALGAAACAITTSLVAIQSIHQKRRAKVGNPTKYFGLPKN